MAYVLIVTTRAESSDSPSALGDEVDKVANVTEALATNRRIGQAVGILMASRRISTEEAFDALNRVSQRTQRKLRDVAEDVCSAGRPPAEATPRAVRSAFRVAGPG